MDTGKCMYSIFKQYWARLLRDICPLFPSYLFPVSLWRDASQFHGGKTKVIFDYKKLFCESEQHRCASLFFIVHLIKIRSLRIIIKTKKAPVIQFDQKPVKC